jgi:hypothetical protein
VSSRLIAKSQSTQLDPDEASSKAEAIAALEAAAYQWLVIAESLVVRKEEDQPAVQVNKRNKSAGEN